MTTTYILGKNNKKKKMARLRHGFHGNLCGGSFCFRTINASNQQKVATGNWRRKETFIVPSFEENVIRPLVFVSSPVFVCLFASVSGFSQCKWVAWGTLGGNGKERGSVCGFRGGIRYNIDFPPPHNNSCLNTIICVTITSLIFLHFIHIMFPFSLYPSSTIFHFPLTST